MLTFSIVCFFFFFLKTRWNISFGTYRHRLVLCLLNPLSLASIASVYRIVREPCSKATDGAEFEADMRDIMGTHSKSPAHSPYRASSLAASDHEAEAEAEAEAVRNAEQRRKVQAKGAALRDQLSAAAVAVADDDDAGGGAGGGGLGGVLEDDEEATAESGGYGEMPTMSAMSPLRPSASPHRHSPAASPLRHSTARTSIESVPLSPPQAAAAAAAAVAAAAAQAAADVARRSVELSTSTEFVAPGNAAATASASVDDTLSLIHI